MASHFERERHVVELLIQRLGLPECECLDPNTVAGHETGADVFIILDGRRIGIQVTEVDTGEIPGQARAEERRTWRASNTGTYGAWAQNDRGKLLASIERTIARKVDIANRHSFAEFQEVWLLASAGLPEMGSIASTLIVTTGIDTAALDAATLCYLMRSKYQQAYLHSILGPEHALYSWERCSRWRKTTLQEPALAEGPSFWDVQKLMRERWSRTFATVSEEPSP